MRTAGVVAAALAFSGLVPLAAAANHPTHGTQTRHSLEAGSTWASRQYLVYEPPHLAPRPRRSVVVFLHGCTQSADEAAAGVRWNQLADERGFVVAYPEQRVPAAGDPDDVDGSGAQCWNWGQGFGYPPLELEAVAEITRRVAATYKVRPGRIFVIGISAGAIMASAMAANHPDLYAATASVIGCGYPCGDASGRVAYERMGTRARRLPAFLVSGSADYLINPAMSEAGVRQWVSTNDWADDGEANGSVSWTPITEHRQPSGEPAPGQGDSCVPPSTPRNPCPAGVIGITEYPVTISRYLDGAGRTVVESWVFHGLSHNYPGGDPDGTFTDPHGPDITEPIYEFFEANARAA